MKIPLVELHQLTSVCNNTVTVGEASDSKCSGFLTILIINGKGNGENMVLKKEVSELTHETQRIQFEKTPKTGGIFPVIATLMLESSESKTDQTEHIRLCQE